MLVEKAKVLHRGPYIKYNSDEEWRTAVKRSAQRYETHKELCKARNQEYFKRPEVKVRVKARRLMRDLEAQIQEVRSDSGGEGLS